VSYWQHAWDVTEADILYDNDPETEVYEESDEETGAESAPHPSDEALMASLNRFGRVDLPFMSRFSGKTYDQLVLDLGGSAIIQDPRAFFTLNSWSLEQGWVLRSQYLNGTGSLRRKLKDARRMNKRFPGRFEQNIALLKSVTPPKVSLEDIEYSIYSPWVPTDMKAACIKAVLAFNGDVEVVYNKDFGTVQILAPEKEARLSVRNMSTYGTVDGLSTMLGEQKGLTAIKILEYMLNGKTVKQYEYVPKANWKYERVFDREGTLAAQEKEKLLARDTTAWLGATKERRARLEECYNDAYVGYTYSPYDGSFLELADLNPEVTLYPYQRNGVARLLLSGNTLFAHDVGSGKTYIMTVGVHELKRMGLSQKNLVVVPNNRLHDTVREHRYLYPDDSILAVYPEDFTPANRQAILEKIRDGDYVAIYMAYSSFDMIVMSKDYWVTKMTQEIEALRDAMSDSRCEKEKRRLQSSVKAAEKRRLKYIDETLNCPWMTFDELGINTLVVDEAHNYKNIPLKTKVEHIVGMHTGGSEKCAQMLEKCHFVDKVVFATATPLTNSLADLFVMQTYLQPEELRMRGIGWFDMWINTFGEKENHFEIDVDSRSSRAMTRFSSFHNLSELMSLFSTVCDFYYIRDDQSELPQFHGAQDVLVPRSERQEAYIEELCERTERIRAQEVPRHEDNLLKVTTDGRKCALDIRLVDPTLSDGDEDNKIKACAGQIVVLYERYPQTCQVVFSDIGTPKASFNVYQALREELVNRGIPPQEIAFAHDAASEAARARLFENINHGHIRVVIGSTAKLGVGVNIQERLIALHHLSVPWRPADMVQREGRILRRGNTCEEVFIYRYVTKGSFDSYSWQMLENKQRFISSFLSGTSTKRDAADIADAVLSYAEVKALAIGNDLIRERVETHICLERTRIAGNQRQKQLLELQGVIRLLPAEIARLEALLDTAKRDIEHYRANKEPIPKADRQAIGEEILEALADNVMAEKEHWVAEFQGFAVMLPANMSAAAPYVWLCSDNGGRYYVEMPTDKALGCCQRLGDALERIGDLAETISEQIRVHRRRYEQAQQDIEQGNPYTARIEELVNKLAEIDAKLNPETIPDVA